MVLKRPLICVSLVGINVTNLAAAGEETQKGCKTLNLTDTFFVWFPS